MSRKNRKTKKTLQALERSEAIKRQQASRERPFRSMIYKGKKAVTKDHKEKNV